MSTFLIRFRYQATTNAPCYVIRIDESDRGPHFINGRKGAYVRTNEFSSRFEAQLANENELRHLFQRRQLVRDRRADLVRRSRQRFKTFAAQKHGELGERRELGIGARFDLSIGPTFPASQLCDHHQLLKMISAKRFRWRQVGFPRTDDGTISQHESVIVLCPGSSFSMLESTTWGMLFYATEIEREVAREENQQVQAMHSYHFVGQLLAFLEHAGITLCELGYSGPLTIEMTLDAIRGIRWIVFERSLSYFRAGSQLDDTTFFSLETTTDQLTSKRDAVAIDILRYVFFATDLTDAMSAQGLEEFVRGVTVTTRGVSQKSCGSRPAQTGRGDSRGPAM